MQHAEDTNYNVVPTQQSWSSFPAAIFVLETVFFAPTALKPDSILVMPNINIYGLVNRKMMLFIAIFHILLHSQTVLVKLMFLNDNQELF